VGLRLAIVKLLDAFDHYIVGHRSYRFCNFICATLDDWWGNEGRITDVEQFMRELG
jgi:hypothetical protein